MQLAAPELSIEKRWPVVLVLLAVVLILEALPRRIMLFPVWIPYIAGIVVLVPTLGVWLAAKKRLWLRLERTITLLFFLVAEVGTLMNLANLIRAMIHGAAEINGMQLLTASIAVWITNVLAFSLLYWQIDRGGPEARSNKESSRPDWLFPQDGTPEAAPLNWRPTFVDYLFLGFSTATAFSPTDALPITSRAKLLMMIESITSLVTIVVVASRAINILGN
jgi:hypothetical protein